MKLRDKLRYSSFWTAVLRAPDGGAGTGEGTGTGTGEGTGTGTGTGEGTGTSAGAHWAVTANLPAEHQSHGFVKGSKDLGDFVKQSIDAQALIGRKGVIVPADGADEKAWDGFFNQLGRPEKWEGYKLPDRKGSDGKVIERAEYETALLSKLLPAAHKSGASQKTIEGLAAAFDLMNQETDAIFTKYHKDASEAFDTKFPGDKGVEMKAAADRFAKKAFGEQYDNMKRLQLVGGGFLLDNPLIAEALGMAGMAMKEDGFVGGTRVVGGDPMSSLETARAYVDRVDKEAENDMNHWRVNAEHPDHKALDKHYSDVLRYIQREERRAKGG